jgi:hypothetical protein
MKPAVGFCAGGRQRYFDSGKHTATEEPVRGARWALAKRPYANLRNPLGLPGEAGRSLPCVWVGGVGNTSLPWTIGRFCTVILLRPFLPLNGDRFLSFGTYNRLGFQLLTIGFPFWFLFCSAERQRFCLKRLTLCGLGSRNTRGKVLSQRGDSKCAVANSEAVQLVR